MFVWSTDSFNASTTYITADDTYLTASISSIDVPVILNPQGSIGTVPNTTFFAYQFTAKVITAETVTFVGNFLPPGLYLDPNTGWLTGFLPDVGLTEQTYNFSIAAYVTSTPEAISENYAYSLTITGPISTNVTWLTPSFLGSIDNGSVSIFYVEATTTAGLPLTYSIASGSESRLPQGLSLLPSGHIAGRVSFNTFALDDGLTTFDNKTTTFDLTCTFTVNAFSINGYISVYKTFTIDVLRTYDKPYNNLYIQCMPPVNDRQLIQNLLQNSSIFTPSLLYRSDDPNFGLSKNAVYYHAYGLDPEYIDTYVESLQLNHYWKNLTLGEIKTAQAIDPVTGKVIYEVVYSEVIDDLVNRNSGESVGKEVVLAYPIQEEIVEIDVVYPNALDNMRDQVIDVVGQTSDLLPLWMQCTQSDGNVLGFTPAWVIAYTIPHESGQIKYNIQKQYGTQLNQVDFEADRYELDNLATINWDGAAQHWIPSPPTSTTFDIDYHYNLEIVNAGTGYAVGSQIKILGTQIGGISPLNDCIITVNTVSNSGSIVSAFYSGTANLFSYGNIYSSVNGININDIGETVNWITTSYNTEYEVNWVNIYDEVDTWTAGSGVGATWNVIPVPGLDATVPATNTWVNRTNVSVSWVNNRNSVVVWSNGGTTTFDTMFDGGSLTFNAPADIYTNTDAYNKYLMFPKYNIITPVPQYNGLAVAWVNSYDEVNQWTNDIDNSVIWVAAD
jgi:hypothetical protein